MIRRRGYNGDFYGTIARGGINDLGAVFRLSVGLGPFVRTLPTSGEVGATIRILGTDLSGTTGVTFDGTAAAFTVVSATEITAIVPAGALTGKVQVTTPGGTLSSKIDFRVRPTISNFVPTGGPIGTVVDIDGESLTGATSVTFDAVPSLFSVLNDTQTTATVPAGAETGPICVTTPGARLVSAPSQ